MCGLPECGLEARGPPRPARPRSPPPPPPARRPGRLGFLCGSGREPCAPGVGGRHRALSPGPSPSPSPRPAPFIAPGGEGALLSASPFPDWALGESSGSFELSAAARLPAGRPPPHNLAIPPPRGWLVNSLPECVLICVDSKYEDRGCESLTLCVSPWAKLLPENPVIVLGTRSYYLPALGRVSVSVAR